jgi:hypothetical protein
MNSAISLLSSVLTFTFAAMLLDQYLEHRKSYQAVWTVSLCIFGLGVLVEFAANVFGWSLAAYRCWFLFGATFAAASLGLGSAYLLLPTRWARWLTALCGAPAAWAVYRVLTMPLSAAAVLPAQGSARPPSVGSVPADMTVLVVAFNVLGTVLVAGGALWSAWLFARRRTAFYRVVSNLLIAAGALILATSGSLAGTGRPEYLFAGELAGIAVIFAGFLRSQPSLSVASLPLLRHLHRVGVRSAREASL